MENNQNTNVLETAILVVIIIVVAPVIINGLLLIGASIYNAFQPKLYDLTLTFEDGTTQTYRGTKKEMEKILASQKRNEAA